MSDSYIQHSAGKVTAYVGDDAVLMFKAKVIRASIGLYLKCGIKSTRAATPTNMALMASQITHKHYTRSKASLAKAAEDLEIWLRAAHCAIPIVED